MKRTKKIIIAAVSLCLVCALTVGLAVYFTQGPNVEDIYDRVVELVESSYALNTVFYGAGLPAYARDSDFAQFSHLYFGNNVPAGYLVVSDYSPYFSIDAIKADAEKIYSRNFLEKVWYPMAFDGYAIEDGAGGAALAYAKYFEEGGRIYLSQNAENYLPNGLRVYDYSTMKVVRPSNSRACFVSMSSWMPNDPDTILTDTIHLVLQDGDWYLDSFTG